MSVDIRGLSKAELQKLKKKLDKQLEKDVKVAAPSINSRDPEVGKLADSIKALAKAKGVANEQVVEAVCRRFRLGFPSKASPSETE